MLNSKEFDLIFDGLDALGKADDTGDVLALMLGVSLAPPDKKQDIINEGKLQREQEKQARRIREEQVIHLKSKLLFLRDWLQSREAEGLIADWEKRLRGD